MSHQIVVQIVGAPIACAEGTKETWREIAQWVAGQLTALFGDHVHVDYFDLFDPDAPPIPAGAQLPLVLVGGDMISQGAKLSIPAIRRRVESMLDSEPPRSTL